MIIKKYSKLRLGRVFVKNVKYFMKVIKIDICTKKIRINRQTKYFIIPLYRGISAYNIVIIDHYWYHIGNYY